MFEAEVNLSNWSQLLKCTNPAKIVSSFWVSGFCHSRIVTALFLFVCHLVFLSTLNPSSLKECRRAVTSAAVDLSLSSDEAVRQTCSDPNTVYSPGRLPDYHQPAGQYLLWIHSRGCKLMLKFLSYSTVTLQHGKMNYCCNSDVVTPPTTPPTDGCHHTHAERLELWTLKTCLLLLKTFLTFVLTRACLTVCSCERADDVWQLLNFSKSKCCSLFFS